MYTLIIIEMNDYDAWLPWDIITGAFFFEYYKDQLIFEYSDIAPWIFKC